LHLAGTGIDGVFQKLFDHGSGAFNHLTGSYLIG
jgi:hypothetical protein